MEVYKHKNEISIQQMIDLVSLHPRDKVTVYTKINSMPDCYVGYVKWIGDDTLTLCMNYSLLGPSYSIDYDDIDSLTIDLLPRDIKEE